MSEKTKGGAGKFILGAALGAIAGAIAGKFISLKSEDEKNAKCDCDDGCDCGDICECGDECDCCKDEPDEESRADSPKTTKAAAKKPENKKTVAHKSAEEKSEK